MRSVRIMGIIDKKYVAHPRLVGIIGAKYGEKINFMTAAWHTYVSINPLLYGVAIGSKTYTHELIEQSEEFTISFLSVDHILQIHSLGKLTGRIYNKIDLVNLKLKTGKKVATPHLEDAYGVLDCKITKKVKTGDHSFFIGKIVDCHGDESVFDKEGIIYTDKAQPTMYLGKNNYITTDKNSEKHFALDE